MNLAAQLATLEASGLIQPVVSGADLEYRFRHALVHDAAYSTLLKQHRRELHKAVGEVLDASNSPVSEEMAPLLGFHFNEAGDGERASRYFAAAGAHAARKYAHHEALSYYSQAIRATPHPPALLFQARGQVFDLQGDFESARRDFEHSAEVARSAGDVMAEWQAVLSLGLLWAQRDYERSGEYCRMAFALAQKTDQPALVARSYNRLGNWFINVEQPLEAARCHDQALSIFQTLHDDAGIAETLDLLGMTSMLSGDLARATRYYQQAIDLNRRLGDRMALSNVLGSQLLAANAGYQTIMLRPGPLAGSDLTAQGEEALRMTREIGWRDGEAFIQMIRSFYAQARGDYSRALRAGEEGLAVATEIGHRQWVAGHHFALGQLYYDVLAYPQAIEQLEVGLAASREIASQHWIRCHIGLLGAVLAASQALDQAASILASVGEIRQPPQSIGERQVTYGRACLAYARGDLGQALETVATLIAAVGPSLPGEPERVIPMLFLLRGTIYAALSRQALAEADFRPAIEAAAAHTERPLLWRLHRALGQLLDKQDRSAEAAQALERARAIVAELAANLPEGTLRDNFLAQSRLVVRIP